MLEGTGKPHLYIVRGAPRAAEPSDALSDWLTTTTSPAMEQASIDQARMLGTDPVILLEACEAIVRAGMSDDGALGLAAIEALHESRRQAAVSPTTEDGSDGR